MRLVLEAEMTWRARRLAIRSGPSSVRRHAPESALAGRCAAHRQHDRLAPRRGVRPKASSRAIRVGLRARATSDSHADQAASSVRDDRVVRALERAGFKVARVTRITHKIVPPDRVTTGPVLWTEVWCMAQNDIVGGVRHEHQRLPSLEPLTASETHVLTEGNPRVRAARRAPWGTRRRPW